MHCSLKDSEKLRKHAEDMQERLPQDSLLIALEPNKDKCSLIIYVLFLISF